MLTIGIEPLAVNRVGRYFTFRSLTGRPGEACGDALVWLLNEGLDSDVTASLEAWRTEPITDPLNGVIAERGRPHSIRCDNGTEFTSQVMDQWAYWNRVVLDFIPPGRPMENGIIEGFNSRFRQECLNEYWFLSVADAQGRVDAWREDYNSERPHGSLGNMTPDEYADQAAARSPHGGEQGQPGRLDGTPRKPGSDGPGWLKTNTERGLV